MLRFLRVFASGTVMASACWAWSGYDVTVAPVQLTIGEIADIEDPSRPTTVEVRVQNLSAGALSGSLELRDFADDWRVEGSASAEFALGPGVGQDFRFAIVSGPFVFTALYPVHAYVTLRKPALREPVHAVRIFRVSGLGGHTPVASAQAFEPVPVPRDGAVLLWQQKTQRVAWHYYDREPVFKPAGWRGSDPVSRASMGVGGYTRGSRRTAINMHPPWMPGGGTVFCDYLLQLPEQSPIALTFANAIRDHTAAEPASDGVRFRVWVGSDADGRDARPVFESFTDTKVWKEGSVDLSPYAGQTVLLRLESDPGPNQSTTCDSSYWAEPTVSSGRPPAPAPAGPLTAADTSAGAAAARGVFSGQRAPDGTRTFLLQGAGEGGRVGVAVEPGVRGLLDGVVTMATGDSSVSFRGLQLDIDEIPVSTWPSAYAFRRLSVDASGDCVRYVHHLERAGEPVLVSAELRAVGPALRLSVRCLRRITRLSVGPWDRRATRVYYGHGYCVVDPEPFRAGFGGHNLATSHVACDFEGGLSVLQAVDTPPNALVVTPADRTYALLTHMDSTLTIVPGPTAFGCAIAYRPLYDKAPAPAVPRLAGRFCFDIWGGRYADIADRMQEMIDYGLTDSFLTVHNWQRWGYDYRLPDIYPPNPRFGTLEDMRRIGTTCDAHDIPWGLHDNYIDIYPDATDYSYRHVYFDRNGQPHKAWYNRGRDAQSYKFRPDHIMQFIRRNYALIARHVQPTHTFLDVFTSSGCMDYRDHAGGFHSSLETRRLWGEAFAYIRDTLGGAAPTTSEAGHDQLTGYLDGADCQWLQLAAAPRKHVITLKCADWERVPWFDAVNHHRFILHGVGYSGRYEGGRHRQSHGINSDDYINAELLSGHALMVDAGCWGRDAVRKYFLAQDVARHLALAKIEDVAFVAGDIHRQRVRWDSGATVCVNRGKDDWSVRGRVLPQYGFHVEYGDGNWCTVERRDGKYLESSRGPSGWFCNARAVPPRSRTLPITPRLEDFRQLDSERFAWTLVWDAKAPAPADLRTFVHFCGTKGRDLDEILFQDDHACAVPPSQWHGQVRVKRTVTVPAKVEGKVTVVVGLYGPNGRVRLGGYAAGDGRTQVGTLQVHRRGDGATTMTLEPPPPSEPVPEPNWNPGRPTADFGFAVTDGAFRVQARDGALHVVPLPESPPFRVTLRIASLLGRAAAARRVEAVAPRGDALPRAVPSSQTAGAVTFRHDGEALAYRIVLE